MYTNTCAKCNQSITTETSRLFINHVRWCQSTERGTNKFQLECSCIICKTLMTSQNIKNHYKSKHEHTQTLKCIVCSSDCSPHSKRFCSRSCSATYSNKTKDYSTFKPGPKKGTKTNTKRTIIPYTKVNQCVYCKKYHTKTAKTCSSVCLSRHLSLVTGGNRDCNIPGTDSFGKDFYFDSGWEILLAESLTKNNIVWSRPDRFVLSSGKTYTPDFYLPDYNVYMDPKAKRPGYYRKSMLKVEMFEKEYDTRCLVISNSRYLTWGHIQTMLLLNVNR